MNVEIIFVVVGAILTILGGAVSAFSERRTKEPKIARLGLKEPTDALAKDIRLKELKELFQRQQFVSDLNSWADSSLTFGQYIIGGLLASSFVQESVPKQVIGMLGVLVLLSSLIRQRYRPDIKAFAAKRRAVALYLFILKIGDSLYEIEKGLDSAPTVFSIRKRVTDFISEIEKSILADSLQDKPKDNPNKPKDNLK